MNHLIEWHNNVGIDDELIVIIKYNYFDILTSMRRTRKQQWQTGITKQVKTKKVRGAYKTNRENNRY